MPNLNSDISIIVTTWNRESFLVDALESILRQDYQGRTQVIVCDDGSTDGTQDVIESYRSKLERLDVVREEPEPEDRLKQLRLAIMINKALPLCDGRYISYLPDDDVYKPERNRLMIQYLDDNQDVYLAYHWMKLLLVSPDKAVVGEALDLCDSWDESMKYWVQNIYNRIDHTSIVHRNLGPHQNIRWNENPIYKRCADWGFLLKVLRANFKIGCVEKYLAIGRKIQGMSLNRDGDQMIAAIMGKQGVKKQANILYKS